MKALQWFRWSWKGPFFVFKELGALSIFTLEIFKTLKCTENNKGPILSQLLSVYRMSLSTVVVSSFFVGAILVIQFSLMLSQFEALSLLGGLTSSAIIREVGPLLISFILAGKIGAYTAAELGTMRVTEQIDAIECLGTNSIQYLIVPRFFAIILASLLLMTLGLMVSTLGAMGIASLLYQINWRHYAASLPQFLSFGTFLGGFTKCLLYSILVAAISCHRGYTTSGGARGVGRAVTLSAIDINIYILFTNFFSGIVFDTIRNLWESFR